MSVSRSSSNGSRGSSDKREEEGRERERAREREEGEGERETINHLNDRLNEQQDKLVMISHSTLSNKLFCERPTPKLLS